MDLRGSFHLLCLGVSVTWLDTVIAFYTISVPLTVPLSFTDGVSEINLRAQQLDLNTDWIWTQVCLC